MSNAKNDASQDTTIPLLPDDFDLFDYKADRGGILDMWLDHCADSWIYVTAENWWYYWDKSHWRRDAGDLAKLGKELLRLFDDINTRCTAMLGDLAEDDPKEKFLKAMKAASIREWRNINSVAQMAARHRFVEPNSLNGGNYFNFPNGTLDLESLETVTDHNRRHFITHCTDYDYDASAECPRWEQFLEEVLVIRDGYEWKPDQQMIDLFQELIGYSLTTDTSHEIMVWLSGEGSNGKTVALNVLNGLLNGLAISINFHAIGKPGNYDLAMIPGKRAIFSTEADKGGSVVEWEIRRIVSGEPMLTRPIYGHPFEFKPVAKIWWAMNDKPKMTDTSNAIWRRLKLIPFNRTFADGEKDVNLTGKLMAEKSGIFNWALMGLARLKSNGKFTDAAQVLSAKEVYKMESNPVAMWCDERAKINGVWTMATPVYNDFTRWGSLNGHNHITQTEFGRELGRLNVSKRRNGSGNMYNLDLLYKDV